MLSVWGLGSVFRQCCCSLGQGSGFVVLLGRRTMQSHGAQCRLTIRLQSHTVASAHDDVAVHGDGR